MEVRGGGHGKGDLDLIDFNGSSETNLLRNRERVIEELRANFMSLY